MKALNVVASQSGQQQGCITITSEPLDLTGHAPDCELRKVATTTICTAEAMNPKRQIIFHCTCYFRPKVASAGG